MSTFERPLLVCTNGDEHTRPALEYSLWLAQKLRTSIDLVGIIEAPGAGQHALPIAEEFLARAQQMNIPCSLRYDQGRGSVVIARLAASGQYLTVVGPLGRPMWRILVQGRSFRRVLARLASPLLYIREAHTRLDKILLCLGGLDYSIHVERFSVQLAQACNASLTILHVVEPVTLEYPLAHQIAVNWQQIVETDTPQGRCLRNAYAAATQAGLPVQVKARHGNIVAQILEEARAGNYDLVAMGSPYSGRSLRHLYMPNVTAEVAEALKLPILTVR